VRRLIDVLAAATGLVVLSPVLLAIALFIKLHDGGPIFYSSRRVGKGGKLFAIHKFRSMVQNAHTMGMGLTMKEDRRVTPIGRVLRRYKLDELPQLFNVITGEMSLVGARPEDPKFVAHYTSDQRRILEYRPGITSPASLKFRNEEELLSGEDAERLYVERLLPQKLTIDLEYQSQRTVMSDMRLILQTIGRMV
jgi:lipopolysaccharide/colanic/teichoic acid biosynthesis glycosyltransferase